MITSFTLTSSSTRSAAPFAIGHAFKQGDVPAGSQLVADFTDFQVTPKNVWGDGSLKFAIVAGRVGVSAGVPLAVAMSIGTPAAGTVLNTASLKATGIVASVSAGVFGSTAWATTDWDAPFMTLVFGPRMSSWTYRKAIGTDPHLVAWLEVRLWAGGEVEVLPWVENGYLLVANPSNKAETYTFSLGGAQRFSASLDILNHTRTPLVSGTAFAYWLGADPLIIPSHNSAYLQSTKVSPKYSAVASESILASLPSSYLPFQQGNYSPSMGMPGYHPSIGILPQWDVAYITSSDPRAYAAVVANGYSAGRFGIHFRDETTNRPIKFSSYPKLVCDSSSGVIHTGLSSTNFTTPTATGTTPPGWTDTHSPSVGFVPYLVTGRFYFAEQMQFAATTNYLLNGDLNRQDSAGIFLSSSGSNTTRGVAWAIRTLAQAAALTPDTDPLQVELVNSTSSNIDWNHTRYVATPNNPQGFVQPYSDYTAPAFFPLTTVAGASTIVLPSGYVYLTDGYYNGYELLVGAESRFITTWVGSTRTATLATPFSTSQSVASAQMRNENVYVEATWMQDFYTAAFGYAIDLAPPVSSMIKTKLSAFFAWKAQSIVGRFGGTAVTDYLYQDAGIYTIAVAPSNTADWVTGAGPWYSNWGQIYKDTLGVNNPGTDTSLLRGGNYPDASSYWGNLQPALAYAVQQGVVGASAARTRMLSASNFSSLSSALSSAPEWAIEPRSIGVAIVTTTGPSTVMDSSSILGAGNTLMSSFKGLGTPISQIASGGSDGTSPIYDAIQAAGGTVSGLSEIRVVVGAGTHGAYVANELGGGVYTGDGSYDTILIDYWLDGALWQSAAPMNFGVGTSDTTVPVMTGAISSSTITTSGFTLSWLAATDNVAVVGYEVSIDAGTSYTNVGNVLTITETGLASATTYQVRVRAYDAANNKAAPLSASVATSATSDTTAPNMQGSLTTSAITASGFTIGWAAASDNVAVTGYEISTDNGTTYSNVGNVLSYACTGKYASTLYNVKVRAYDAAGNRSTPLSTTATTTASSDTTAPVFTGSLTITSITTGGFTTTWPSATDNVAVAGYEISVDSGTPSYVALSNVLTNTKTGLASATQFNVRVRAYDSAGNRSAALTTTATTATAVSYATTVTVTFQDRTSNLRTNLTGMKWAWFDQVTPNNLLAPTAKGTLATTNSSGVAVLNITGTQLPPGATGWLVFSNSDGTATQTNLISFAGPCVAA